MPGYNGTSQTEIYILVGSQSWLTQSALSFAVGERLQLTYTINPTLYMLGTITAYNAVTGALTVNIDTLSQSDVLQPPFNTQPWGTVGGVLAPWSLSLIGSAVPSTVPVVPTILVRTIDPGEPQYGQGTNNFLSDINAVAQIIVTRLKLLQGEWWENTSTGTPLFQSLLGQATTIQAVGLIIRNRILGTPYVLNISSFSIAYGPSGRTFTFTATVQTSFGAVTVTNAPIAVNS